MIFPLIITSMSNWCSLTTLKSPIYPIHIHFRLPKASRWLEEESSSQGRRSSGRRQGSRSPHESILAHVFPWSMFISLIQLWKAPYFNVYIWYLSRFCILLGFGENKMALICLVMSCILSFHNHKFGAQTPWQVAQVPAAVGDLTGDCISGQ